MRDLTWFEPGEALDVRTIEAAESRLGVKLPADYREFVSKHDSASNPEESSFALQNGKRQSIRNFGALLSLRPEQPGAVPGLFETLQFLGKQLPPNVIPMIATGNGDYICLDYSAGTPSVVYFDHEIAEKAVIYLANSFESFLEMLQVPDDR